MKKPITLVIIRHDDLQGYKTETLYADYFSWLKTELEFISGREVIILLRDHGESPKYSGYNYKQQDATTSLNGWRKLLQHWRSTISKDDPDQVNLVKILLLTRDNILETPGVLVNRNLEGLAELNGSCAIASITSYRAPAHEIGHMLGATHEDGEVVYDGWWHDSIMLSDEFSSVRGNVYRFSDKNRENIREHLSRFP